MTKGDPVLTPRYTLRSNTISRAVARANLTHREAAAQAGIHPGMWSRLMRGVAVAGPRTRRRIMACSLFEEFGFDDLFESAEGGAA